MLGKHGCTDLWTIGGIIGLFRQSFSVSIEVGPLWANIVGQRFSISIEFGPVWASLVLDPAKSSRSRTFADRCGPNFGATSELSQETTLGVSTGKVPNNCLPPLPSSFPGRARRAPRLSKRCPELVQRLLRARRFARTSANSGRFGPSVRQVRLLSRWRGAMRAAGDATPTQGPLSTPAAALSAAKRRAEACPTFFALELGAGFERVSSTSAGPVESPHLACWRSRPRSRPSKASDGFPRGRSEVVDGQRTRRRSLSFRTAGRSRSFQHCARARRRATAHARGHQLADLLRAARSVGRTGLQIVSLAWAKVRSPSPLSREPRSESLRLAVVPNHAFVVTCGFDRHFSSL